MAVRILKKFRLGDGSTGYDFELHKDPEQDARVYGESLVVEEMLRDSWRRWDELREQ